MSLWPFSRGILINSHVFPPPPQYQLNSKRVYSEEIKNLSVQLRDENFVQVLTLAFITYYT